MFWDQRICANFEVRQNPLQVKADSYEKINKELLEFVEDVLLNRCENATERILEYAGSLDPKSKPTDVRKKGQVLFSLVSAIHLSFTLQETAFA